MRPPRTAGWALAALVAAFVFHLWDGRSVEVAGWIQHGDEYVATLPDGRVLILRQSEVREVREDPSAPRPSPPGRAAPRPPPAR